MRQIFITKAGGPEVLKIEERPDPTPGTGEVAIRVEAVGINFADILARRGLYPDAPKFPCVVGYEVSGTVEATGEDVDTALVGKAVVAITRFNGYADMVVVPVGQVVEKPEHIDFEQGAGLPVTYLTAYQLLVVMGGLRKGESVLIHNAGGGVGLAALDLARKIGAVTYGTASPGKHDFLKKRGLDYAIDYRTQDWTKVLAELTEDKGVELVIDPIGGAHWKKSYAALRHTGRLGMFGVSSAAEKEGWGSKWRLLKVVLKTPWFHPIPLIDANRGVFGVNLGHLWHEREKVMSWLQEIVEGVGQGWVRPHVDSSFSFAEVGAAHTYIEERRNIGKVVLLP